MTFSPSEENEIQKRPNSKVRPLFVNITQKEMHYFIINVTCILLSNPIL